MKRSLKLSQVFHLLYCQERTSYFHMSTLTSQKVMDAPADSWVYRFLPKSIWPYAQLARWDRPIGWRLLLWPCWWSLALASNNWQTSRLDTGNQFDWWLVFIWLLIFQLGAIAMRGAGCTYNDIVDVPIDEKVTRTASRPIPSGRVNKVQAMWFTIAQSIVGLGCLLILCQTLSDFNEFAFWLAIASLIIVAFYPFAKRLTDWPQLVLGLAFSWGALLGWAVVFEHLSVSALLLYSGSVLWTIGYDTIYAHQDREDDVLIGVRSTARLFGENTKPALITLYFATLVLFALAFNAANVSWPAYIGLLIGTGQMIWQIRTLNIDDADNCLKLFKSNSKFGWILFAGISASILI